MANEAQITHWAGEGGRAWVREHEHHDRMLEVYGSHVVEALAPQPGERILDVGCGSGALSLAIARRVEPDGTVTGVDISTPMLALARQRAQEAGSANVSFVEADAQVHTFEPGSFDAVTSRFGVMFFDDPVTAFTNLRGALRPGGRLAFVCWRDLASNDWMHVPVAAALAHVPPPDFGEPGTPGPFALADPEWVRSLLVEAGFTAIGLGEVDEMTWIGPGTDEAVAFLQRSSMARTLMAGVDDETAARAWQAVAEVIESHGGADGIHLKGAAWLVTAVAAG